MKNFKFSRIKYSNDVDFNVEIINKNPLNLSEESEECRQIKETTLSGVISNIREYIQRIELKKEISILKKKQTSVSHKLTALHEKLQIKREDKDIRNLDKNIHLYEENLAFKIKDERNIKKEEVYRSFDFSNIIESDPQKTCSIVLKITEKNNYNVYKATRCDPEITGIEELISSLNITNDEHEFIINVRKKFQQSLAEMV